jgi:hypothetical protein
LIAAGVKANPDIKKINSNIEKLNLKVDKIGCRAHCLLDIEAGPSGFPAREDNTND